MTTEERPESRRLGPQREATIEALCEHFADDVLSVEEFERRIDTAHRASTPADLEALLQDLPARHLPTASPRQEGVSRPEGYSVTSPERVKDQAIVMAVMGGTSRKGRWSPARKNYSIALMGGAELDFREAVMPPGVTELRIYAMWGGVDVIVPPGLHVESHGFAVLGGFDHAADDALLPGPHAPTLRITGLAVMGGVDITVRHPGESAREARRRRRLESKERKRLGDGS
jgi:hypothetical protein